MTLRTTRLIQRMKAPKAYNTDGETRPHHVFTGPMGLSKEGWKILDQLCTLDYMGAAEYEAWGGEGPTPKALSIMWEWAQQGQLKPFAFVLGPHERELNRARKYARKGKVFPPAKFVTLFGLAHEEMLVEVQDRVRALAQNENSFPLKRGAKVTDSLDPIDEWDHKDPVLGWLELNNSFLFFSDQTMWKGFCDLFGVEPCEVPALPMMVDYTQMKKPELVKAALSLGMFVNRTAANEVKKPELLRLLMEAQEKDKCGSASSTSTES